MQPTMIRENKTKDLKDLEPGENAFLEIGGVRHVIRRKYTHKDLIHFPEGGKGGRSVLNRECFFPDTEVTVTESRPMIRRDLEYGEACIFVDRPEGDVYIQLKSRYMLRIGEGEAKRVHVPWDQEKVALVEPSGWERKAEIER